MILKRLVLALAVMVAAGGASAATLPLEKIKLPPGFHIAVWAEVEGARSMAVGNGFVVVGTRDTSLYAVPFDARTYRAGKAVEIADDLDVPNGVALLDGVLYIAEQPRLVRWGNAPFSIARPKQTPVQVGPNLPDESHHGWRYLSAAPDGALYVTLGSPCNLCTPKGLEGSILRVDPKTGASETIARGIRNSVGMAFHPVTKQLYFTDNGVDMMGDNTPSDELNLLSAKGQHFGFPWYGGGSARTASYLKQTVPPGTRLPVAEFNAHSAALGLAFETGPMFPAAYRNHAFVAHHGSWNRTFPIGYRLMDVATDDTGKVGKVSQFATGWLDKGRAWGRPVDVKFLPDGSMLVSDDHAGVIYRITYGK